MNPLIRTVLSTTRTWTDANRDYVPDCDLRNPAAKGECGRMDNQNFGKEVFTRFFDPKFINGWICPGGQVATRKPRLAWRASERVLGSEL